MIRLAVRVDREQAEVALAELLALDPRGLEERELEDGSIEYAFYGAPGEVPSLPDLRAAVGTALVDVATEEVADDWAQRWKRFHQPITISGADGRPALRVRPPWTDAPQTDPPQTDPPQTDPPQTNPPPTGPGPTGPGPTDAGPTDPRLPRLPEVIIDPGQAFGTGAHATTRLSLELLVEATLAAGSRAGPLCDIGCGSGVLAIAAARLGWDPVVAVDNDPESLRAARENSARNGVEIEVARCDVRREPPPPGSTMVANLLRYLLLDLAGRLEAVPDRLIASGLLVEEADEVAGVFTERLGLCELRRATDAGWAALLLERSGSRPAPILDPG